MTRGYHIPHENQLDNQNGIGKSLERQVTKTYKIGNMDKERINEETE
jgi:hypothetical protein